MRTQPPEHLQTVEPGDKVCRANTSSKTEHFYRWNMSTHWSLTCERPLWSWWNRGSGWASTLGQSGGWGGAFCLMYREHKTPETTNRASVTKEIVTASSYCSSITVRPCGKSKQSAFWAAAPVPSARQWLELKSRGWWRFSCCSFSGFCVNVAENSNFCRGIWGGERLRTNNENFNSAEQWDFSPNLIISK